jgi:HD-GYP domain-containing protein (c-di-GMP phosphodiesterase class II)
VVIQQIRNTLFAKAIHIDLVPAGVGGTQSYNFDPDQLLGNELPRDNKAGHLNGHAGEIKIQPYMDRFAMASVSLVGRQQHLGQLLVVGQEHAVREDSWRSHFETVAGQLTIALEHVMILDRFKQTNDQLVQAQNNLLAGWARALEYKDRETQGHSDRVTDLTRKLGEKLEISAGDIDIMVQGAVLHDIGKMAIPDSILHKNGPLSPQEWAVMKQHPLYAQEFLKEVNFLEDAMIIPLYHHERWDGSGYPFGMAGKNIPLAARIFAIIDRWDALTHDRPYRKAWTADVTITHLRSIAGTEIDPELVELFIQVVNQE